MGVGPLAPQDDAEVSSYDEAAGFEEEESFLEYGMGYGK